MGRLHYVTYLGSFVFIFLLYLYVANEVIKRKGDEYVFFVVILTIATISVMIRRLHDINFRGWWALVPPMFAIAWISLMVTYLFSSLPVGIDVIVKLLPWLIFCPVLLLMFIPGTKGPNRFGN